MFKSVRIYEGTIGLNLKQELKGQDINIFCLFIKCKNLNKDYIFQIAEKVKEFFHNEGIHSTTIQPEFVEVKGQGKHGF